jgi:hypothetical protein
VAPEARPAGLPAASRPRQPQQPVALLYGRGRLIVHANPAFLAEFGAACVGVPASETLTDWPRRAFDVIDRAIETGRPVATWVTVASSRRRLTVAPRADIETGEIYGVALRLAAEGTVPAA